MHQFIITQQPHLVKTSEHLDDHDSFEPIKLGCAVDNNDITKTESTYGKLSVVVTYRDCYIEKNGKQALLLIGLGNGVAVNTLFGLTTLLSWKIVI